MAVSKYVPTPTKISARFWAECNNHKFYLQQCASCGDYIFYPGYACHSCLGDVLEWKQVSGRGTIHASTVVERAPNPAFQDDVPYVVALIELEEGPIMMSNVVNADPYAVAIGDEVQVTFRSIATDVTLPVFELSGRSASKKRDG